MHKSVYTTGTDNKVNTGNHKKTVDETVSYRYNVNE